MHECQIWGGGRLWHIFGGQKNFCPHPDPPLSQKFADPLTILKFADLRLPTPVFWSSHMYAETDTETQACAKFDSDTDTDTKTLHVV